MGLIYCGIDEAGYGPMLGPLCVGFCAFRIADWDSSGGAPDLWQTLAPAVSRTKSRVGSSIAVADSKKLKLSNQSKTRHPLIYLERGVLSFASLLGNTEPAKTDVSPVIASGADISPAKAQHDSALLDSDEALFAALGTHLENHAWYKGDSVSLPLGTPTAQLAIARNRLALACEAAKVEPIALACIAVGEHEFNEVIRLGRSKAHLTSRCFGKYLRRAVERWGDGHDEIRFVCDRHGGRTSYASMIEAALRGLGYAVQTLEETSRCSRYALCTQSTGGVGSSPVDAKIIIQFRPEAEDAHLPVALASMTAKFVRELAMARFNRYWCSRITQLKPTAGYVQDARRWLEDAGEAVSSAECEAMVRLA